MKFARPSESSNCECDQHKLAIKDTVCGINPLINLQYCFILLCCLFSLSLYILYLVKFHRKNDVNYK